MFATHTKTQSVLFCRQFQSLSGVFDVCNRVQQGGIPYIARFQSLSGVLDFCNVRESENMVDNVIGFNPFQGF